MNAALDPEKTLKYSLKTTDSWTRLTQLNSLPAQKTDLVSCLQVELSPDFSIKICGLPINFGVLPFICATGSLNEFFTTFFLLFVKRTVFYLVRQQTVGFWKTLMLRSCTKTNFCFFERFFTSLSEKL
jgi:hypothetical protein